MVPYQARLFCKPLDGAFVTFESFKDAEDGGFKSRPWKETKGPVSCKRCLSSDAMEHLISMANLVLGCDLRNDLRELESLRRIRVLRSGYPGRSWRT